MAHEDPVPEYTEGGSLEDDLRRIAEASDITTSTTQNSITTQLQPSNRVPEVEVNSGDPDTDDLIRRLLREDAEETETQRPTDASGPIPPANIVQTFFDAIENENSELISAFIDGGFVKVNTKDRNGVTPLVAAVRANHVRIVQQLVDYGADVNEMTMERDPDTPSYPEYRRGYLIPNRYENLRRTPLMAAAEKGHLPLVKLFVEVFHAKDDIVPPDGMIALRLAAKNGHREVVEYLPSRRTGGMQRWKYKNRRSLRRARILIIDIYQFIRVIFYDIPRFFVWSIPKHLVVRPVTRSAVYLWKHKRDIANGVKDGIVATGRGIKDGVAATGRGIAKYSKKAAIGTVNGIKAIPSATVRAAKATGRGIVTGAKATWKFFTTDFPRLLVRFIKATLKFIKDAAIALKKAIVGTAKALKKFIVWFAKAIWKLLTVTIPKLISITFKWIWGAIKYIGKGIAGFFIRLASAVHTLFTKMVDWVSGITWKDVLDGFLETLRFVFVGIPVMIFDGIVHTAKFIKKVLKTLFGWVGEGIYYLGLGIILLVVYVPRKIFELFIELFKSIGRGLHEIAVWVNPKTVG